MNRTYCHTHSKYDCPTCADEILSLGIQADKDRIAALELENKELRANAARFLRLKAMYHGAHFDYDESQKCVIVFAVPDHARISANLEATIDWMIAECDAPEGKK